MSKRVNISLEVDVDDHVTDDQIADIIQKALGGHKPAGHPPGKVTIKTTDKATSLRPGGGYESRLWEKVTC